VRYLTEKYQIMETSIAALKELQHKLRAIKRDGEEKKVFVGFDGFVDKIKKAVQEKRDFSTLYFNTMKDFAERITYASGKSGQIETEVQEIKFGGNGPIMANTLAQMGVHSVCIGSLGYPVHHPVFSKLDPKVEVISVLEPGLSDAVEFSDGKIIFSELKVFEQYNWKHIRHTVSMEVIKKAVKESALLAFVDWANLPHASDLWQGMLHDVIMPSGRKNFIFLFDLCDPSKKTTEQIDEVLDVISCFSHYGRVILGLNENEALKIWSALNGIDPQKADERKIPSVIKAGDCIYKTMNIDSLLVHPIDRTLLFQKHATLEMMGRFVTKPKVLTGGGDNLNAGFCLGLLHGLSMPQCLLLGMAASGSYIENGANPNLESLIAYIDTWMLDLKTPLPGTKTAVVGQHENQH